VKPIEKSKADRVLEVVERNIVKEKLFQGERYALVDKEVPANPNDKNSKRFDLLFENQASKKRVAVEGKETHSRAWDPQLEKKFWAMHREIETLLAAQYSGYLISIPREIWGEILLEERNSPGSWKVNLLKYVSEKVASGECTKSQENLGIPNVTYDIYGPGSLNVTENTNQRLPGLIVKANQQLPSDTSIRRVFIITNKHLFLSLENVKGIVERLDMTQYPNIDEIWFLDEYSMDVAGQNIEEIDSPEELLKSGPEVSPVFECVYGKTGSWLGV